jgi:hypothetical protein
MADLTDDPTDPRLTRGVDAAPAPQADAYLVLSDTERAKGFVRPVRRSYVHVGPAGHEIDPDDPRKHGRTLSVLGDLACGRETTMSLEIAETYARDPKFYGATYCVGCQAHLPVAEFVWADGSGTVGS